MNRRKLLIGGGAMAGIAMSGPLMAKTKGGFYVPAEEAPHQATFMQWPVNREVHPDGVFLEMAQQTIADVANAIAAFEPVIMLADQADHAGARRKLSENVELWDIPTEDLWCRDAGPIFVVNGKGEMAVSQIQFNGWGESRSTHATARLPALWPNGWNCR